MVCFLCKYCRIYIAANSSRFSGIILILTLSLDFLISIVIFNFLKNFQPKEETENSCTVQSQSKFFPTRRGYFLGAWVKCLFAGGRSVKMLASTNADSSEKVKQKENASALSSKCKEHSSTSPGADTLCIV